MGGGSTVNMTLSNRAGHSYIVGHHIGDGSDDKVNKMKDGKKMEDDKVKDKKRRVQLNIFVNT